MNATITRLPVTPAGPKPGSMAWIRAWHGVPAKRGAIVRVDGELGWIASATGGLLHVHMWADNTDHWLRPDQIEFAS